MGSDDLPHNDRTQTNLVAMVRAGGLIDRLIQPLLFSMQNTGILKNEWYSLWTQHTLFYCYFFFPALIGIYCAYLGRLEHFNGNWHVLLTAPGPFIVHCLLLALLFSAIGIMRLKYKEMRA